MIRKYLFQRAELNSVNQMYNERRHQIHQCERNIANIRESTEQHQQQILKIIPEARLNELLQYDEKQLNSLTFDQIKGAKPTSHAK